MSTFADRLKELRGPESQASFAGTIGINKIQYAKYEGGKNAPSIDVLTRICRAHDCSADWLLGLKDKKSTAVDFLSTKATSGGIAIGGVGNRVSGTIVAGGDAGHAAMCRTCPYKKWGEKLRKQGLIIPGVE